MFTKMHVIQYPSGNWGFVGSVHAMLTWQNKDGTPLTDSDIEKLRYLSNPGMLYKSKSFKTKDDALKAAKDLNCQVENS